MTKACESEAELAAFIEGFERGTIPKEMWTHEAHVVMAAHYLTMHSVREATRLAREGIPRYNEAQGGKNTSDSGYHETLTVFWIAIVAGFLASLPASMLRLDCIRATAERFGRQAGYHKRFYTYDVIGDPVARREWTPPEPWR